MRRAGPLSAVVVFACLSGLGCRIPVGVERKPGEAPRCQDGVCLEVVSFLSHRETIGVWIEAPPATTLVNARVAADSAPPCEGQFPLAWVKVDRDLHRTGPAAVGGSHGLVLGFPINTWWSHSGSWGEMFLDVQLDVLGTSRCLRTRLTQADGKLALGS